MFQKFLGVGDSQHRDYHVNPFCQIPDIFVINVDVFFTNIFSSRYIAYVTMVSPNTNFIYSYSHCCCIIFLT